MNHNFAKNESRLADKSHFLRFILFILRTYILSYFDHYSNTLGDLREKFKDDSKEYMAKKGMGVVYIKDYNDSIIALPTNSYKTKVIKHYYNKHHDKLNKIVSNKLNK